LRISPVSSPSAGPQTENLAGLVEHVTFHNEENGFCVLRLKARGQASGSSPRVRGTLTPSRR